MVTHHSSMPVVGASAAASGLHLPLTGEVPQVRLEVAPLRLVSHLHHLYAMVEV